MGFFANAIKKHLMTSIYASDMRDTCQLVWWWAIHMQSYVISRRYKCQLMSFRGVTRVDFFCQVSHHVNLNGSLWIFSNGMTNKFYFKIWLVYNNLWKHNSSGRSYVNTCWLKCNLTLELWSRFFPLKRTMQFFVKNRIKSFSPFSHRSKIAKIRQI